MICAACIFAGCFFNALKSHGEKCYGIQTNREIFEKAGKNIAFGEFCGIMY